MVQVLVQRLASLPDVSTLAGDLDFFEEFRSIFSRPFLALHFALELYTSRIALLLALDLGWENKLRQGTTLDDLSKDYPAQTHIAIAWMLSFLTQQGLLTQQSGRFYLIQEPDLDLKSIRAFCQREVPGQETNFDLLDTIRRQIRPFFTEGKTGESLLFDLTLFPLWLSYFQNDNLVYRPNNILALAALRDGLKEGSSVLELGAGVGSFVQWLVQDGMTKNYLGKIQHYHFTDVAPAFLRRAQRELPSLTHGLSLTFSKLDINQDLSTQGILSHSMDAIVGINVLHVAKDLERTLRDLRTLLKPGGRLILGECMKPQLRKPIYIEFIFNFMQSFTDVQLNPDFRPVHGFLTPEAWRQILFHSGFQKMDEYPTIRPLMERYPSFFIGAMAATA